MAELLNTKFNEAPISTSCNYEVNEEDFERALEEWCDTL